MKKSILNLKGVTLLNNVELKKFKGGQTCRFTVTMNGVTQTSFYQGFQEGSSGSAQANNSCLSVLANTQATRCKYDCAWDGMGQ
jgi:hypothetical protein